MPPKSYESATAQGTYQQLWEAQTLNARDKHTTWAQRLEGLLEEFPAKDENERTELFQHMLVRLLDHDPFAQVDALQVALDGANQRLESRGQETVTSAPRSSPPEPHVPAVRDPDDQLWSDQDKAERALASTLDHMKLLEGARKVARREETEARAARDRLRQERKEMKKEIEDQVEQLQKEKKKTADEVRQLQKEKQKAADEVEQLRGKKTELQATIGHLQKQIASAPAPEQAQVSQGLIAYLTGQDRLIGLGKAEEVADTIAKAHFPDLDLTSSLRDKVEAFSKCIERSDGQVSQCMTLLSKLKEERSLLQVELSTAVHELSKAVDHGLSVAEACEFLMMRSGWKEQLRGSNTTALSLEARAILDQLSGRGDDQQAARRDDQTRGGGDQTGGGDDQTGEARGSKAYKKHRTGRPSDGNRAPRFEIRQERVDRIGDELDKLD